MPIKNNRHRRASIPARALRLAGWYSKSSSYKYDGYRMLARVDRDVRIFTRNGHDWTSRVDTGTEKINSVERTAWAWAKRLMMMFGTYSADSPCGVYFPSPCIADVKN